MNKVFEDEYMDLQSGLISLCLEVCEGKVDKVYAYASIEASSTSFNAFFRVNGKIVTLDQLNIDEDLCFQFLMIGTKDLDKIEELCIEHNKPIPREIRMIYDVKTGHYDADYKYDSVCSEKTGLCAGEVFDTWIEEEKNKQ